MDLMQRVRGHFDENIAVTSLVQDILSPQIAQAAEKLMQTLIVDARILACGNGTSASQVQQFAAAWWGALSANARVCRR